MSRNFTPDETLIDLLLLDDTSALEELHHRYCFSLYRYCVGKLHSHEDAQQIVRDIFISLWEDRHTLPVGFPLSIHLYSAVRRAVIQRLNEKLHEQGTAGFIEKQIIPGFSLNYLLKARQPVKISSNEHSSHTAILENNPVYRDQWWIRQITAMRLKNLKHTFRHLLSIF